MAQLTNQQAFDRALQHHQAGRLQEAEQLYRQILAQQPTHVGAMHYLGVMAHQQGRNSDAIDLIRKAIALNRKSPEPYNNLGLALMANGQADEAIAAYRRAIVLKPNYVNAFFNLGVALQSRGQLDEAIAAYRSAIGQKPDHAGLHFQLASALKDQRRFDEAIAAYRQAIALAPNWSEAHFRLAIALQDRGRLDEAIVAYRQAITLNHADANSHCNLGNALRDRNRLDESVAAYRQAIALDPKLPEAHNNLGCVLIETGQLDAAIVALETAIALRPAYGRAYCNLGNALRDKGLFNEAVASFRQAIALQPDYHEAFSNLGNALAKQGLLDDAIAAHEQAIALRPDYAEAFNNLGNVFKINGQLDQAIAAFRQAVALAPDNSVAHSNLAYTLNFHPAYDAAAIAEELRRWNRQHAGPIRQARGGLPQSFPNDREPDRRLRVGYVSADFWNHASAHFLVPLLKNHDPQQVEIFCYAQVPQPDAMTQTMQLYVRQWRSTVGLSDEQMASQIREDRIDILVDLKLHTADNRLLVFARKPAPLQVTWLGYPGSTGLETIDYRLSDPYLDPSGMDESVYSEKTIRLLETFWCYDSLDGRPIAVSALPALEKGVITFGCLNNFSKMNDGILALWARVLREVKDSRLMLLAPPGSHRQRTLDRLSQEGIDPARIEFLPRQSRQKYFESYRGVDIGLDSFPCNGHTTSLDSFWMGVPVVTLVGQTLFSRAGWSELSNLGLGELAGQSPDQFVQIAVDLANDLPRLQTMRSTLRQRMEQSPLMDAPCFARNIEAAYRKMWRRWCEIV